MTNLKESTEKLKEYSRRTIQKKAGIRKYSDKFYKQKQC